MGAAMTALEIAVSGGFNLKRASIPRPMRPKISSRSLSSMSVLGCVLYLNLFYYNEVM